MTLLTQESNYSELSLYRTFIVVFLLIGTALYAHLGMEWKDIPLQKPFNTFPTQIGKWEGVETHFNQKVYDILGVDDSLLMDYKSDVSKIPINLYIGYYKSQRKGDLIHSPQNCMPGAGWNITQDTIQSLGLNENLKTTKLLIQKGDQKSITLYWFQTGGQYISNEYMQKLALIWNAFLHRRTDGAFIRLIAPIGEEGEVYSLNELNQFATDLIPILNTYLPRGN